MGQRDEANFGGSASGHGWGEDMRRLCRLGGSKVHQSKTRVSWQAAVFLFWVHSWDSLCDLGAVTFPQHCCLSICEVKASVSLAQAFPGWGRLMRRSLQSVWNGRRQRAARSKVNGGQPYPSPHTYTLLLPLKNSVNFLYAR